MAHSPRLLLLLPLMLLRAQTGTGIITGKIVDQAGNVVPDAMVVVTSGSSGQIRRARASPAGEYTVPDISPGKYDVELSSPAYVAVSRRVVVRAGLRTEQNFTLEKSRGLPSAAPDIIRVTEARGQLLGEQQIFDLPVLTRNPYQLGELAANISDAGLGTRGAGFAINGQREDSTNVLLDGAGNNNEFGGSIGQAVPLESVREIVVLATGFSSEYGRASGGIVNLFTKRGSDQFHGSIYEFHRGSEITSNSFQDNANGIEKAGFGRNQFGYAIGGPVIPGKLYFFSNSEAVLVRSAATTLAWIPTPQFLAQTSPNTQGFFEELGQFRSDAQIVGKATLDDLTRIFGRNPCIGFACATLPAALPLFNHVAWRASYYSDGGFPQNTVNSLERVDWKLSDRTSIYARYGLYREQDPAGILSSSPYAGYDLGQHQWNNTALASVTCRWNPQWTSESRLAFNRFNMVQAGITTRGVVPSMYANPLAPVVIGNDNVAFPGYNPFSPGVDGTFGGAQNYLEFDHDVSWTRGNHSLRFGGHYDYIRDNRTDAAYQGAADSLSTRISLGAALDALLSGQFARIDVAVYPQGKFPCMAGQINAACTLDLPAAPPSFSRSNRFHEGALYVQDYWKIARRLAVYLGLRWEHFGVQHNSRSGLDANWYAPGVIFADDHLGAYLRNGGLQLASRSSVGRLWKPDWKDFGPRAGIGWDVFGNGRISLRAGYGTAFERNFGNVTFNVIQNPPNYAVLHVPGPISTNNFGPLANRGVLPLPPVGARIVDPGIKTASARFWNTALNLEVTSRIAYSFDYSGSRGTNLYTISYPNQIGFGNFALGDPCSPGEFCTSQPNPSYSEDVGYRGNQGFSNYHSFSHRLTVTDFRNKGVSFSVSYTWSHAVDNISSTFFESGGQGVASQYGNQNITINNGRFDTGLLDPYHPSLDRGDADFDVRHRLVLFGTWELPARRKKGWMENLLQGWNFSPILVMRSGQPFSVFDTSTQVLDLSAPRASFRGPVPNSRNTFVASAVPDVVHLITFLPSQIAKQPNPLTPGAQWPADMSLRNSFRAPGFWNLDLAVYHDIRIKERFTLQMRAELFNVFNHANLYVIGATADVGRGNTVDACFGCTGSIYDRRQVQLAAKLIF